MAQLGNLSLPDMSGDSLTAAKKVDLLSRYLAQLNRQLAFVLENIDADNLADSLRAEIENAAAGAERAGSAVTRGEYAAMKSLMSGAVWKTGTIDGQTVYYLSRE